MKVFITGAQGFVGRELVSQCEEKGFDVTTVDLAESPKPNHHQVDIRSKDIMQLIPEGTDAVIHLAGLTRNPDCKDRAYDCFDANVMATLNLMDAAEKKDVKQFIFASSEWVYDNCTEENVKDEESPINIVAHTSEYALSKLVSEANLRQKWRHGFCSTTILRFGIIYGSRKKNWSAVESLFNTVKTKDEVEIGSLRTGRCFVHVSDIAAGIIQAIGLQGFNILNLEGDGLITLGAIIEASNRILGKDIQVKEKDASRMSIRDVSNKKAKDVLGWEPKINIETGLRKLHIFLSEEREDKGENHG